MRHSSYQISPRLDQTIPSFAVLANNSDCDDRQLPIGVLAKPSSLVIWGNTAFARALAFLINAARIRRERNRAFRAQIATGYCFTLSVRDFRNNAAWALQSVVAALIITRHRGPNRGQQVSHEFSSPYQEWISWVDEWSF